MSSCKADYTITLAGNFANEMVAIQDKVTGGKSLVYGFGKLGNIYSIGNIAASLVNGDVQTANETSASLIGGWLAGTAITVGAGMLTVSLPALLVAGVSIAAGTYVSYKIDNYYAQKKCDEPDHDPTKDFTPDPDDSNGKDYRIEYYDPIVLDLNGNGIGTVAKFGYHGVMFDHDNDGIATATGWVDKEDGLLVRDINKDGQITNGTELFGDNTILQNGQKATNGMTALADLDTNQDGIIDKHDTAFAELKVWQDKNSDGISQADELLSLEDIGIASINLNEIDTSNQSVDGGIIKQTATFTKTDGTKNTLADVNFSNDSIRSKFINKVEVSQEIKKLPNVYGSGRLDELHQSAMKFPELAKILEKYTQATTRQEQKQLLDALMNAWAKTDPQYTDSAVDIMRFENARWKKSSTSSNVIRLRRGEILPKYLTEEPAPKQIANKELTAKVKFVDAMLGISPTKTLYEIKFSQIQKFEEAYNNTKLTLYKNLLNQTLLKPYLESVDVYTNGKDMVMTFDKLEKLLQDKYATKPLEALEDLKDLLSLNGKMLEVGGFEKGFVWLQEWRHDVSEKYNLKEYIDNMFKEFETDSKDGSNTDDFVILTDEKQKEYLASFGNDVIFINGEIGKTVDASFGDDILISGQGDDYLIGGNGRNTYIFHKNSGYDFVNYDNTGGNYDKLSFVDIRYNDVVFYQQGKNLIISFGANQVTVIGALDEMSTKELVFKFSDKVLNLNNILEEALENLPISDTEIYINGWKGSDKLNGNDVDNQIFAFDGHDTLMGGRGNDVLVGGKGIDSYHFSNGDGIDEIIEEDYSIEASHIVFDDVISSEIQKVVFSGLDLVIHYGLADKIILRNYLDNVKNAKLSIGFADDSVWYHDELMSKATFEGSQNGDIITGTLDNQLNIINGNGGNDTIHGNQIAQNHIDGGDGWDELHGGNNIDIITGSAGEDFIYGLAGDDQLDGGDDHDTLFGGEGDDNLIGGNGNDWLQGDSGADTLIGGLGDDSYDVDEFDTFIEKENEGYDAIFIENNFDLAGTNLEEIHLKGTGDFKAIGDNGNNGLYGNAGNNYLDGKQGADTMQGNGGNDYYVVDNEFDNVIENINEGIDTLEQHTDRYFYTQDEHGNHIKTDSYAMLFGNVENLILKGQAKTAFGNDLDNIITLNEQNNFINALSGNDTIIYQKGGGKDTIVSADSLESKDSLVIDGYSLSEAVFVRVTNTASQHDMLQIRFKGSNDQITLLDYFANEVDGRDNRIDEITFKQGDNLTTLSRSEFETKIYAQSNNHAPQVNKYPKPVTAHIGTEFLVQFDKDTIKDADPYDNELSYRITLTTKNSQGKYESIPSWLTFDPATLTLKGTPPEGAKGNLQFILWGEDTFNHSAGTYVNLTISNPTPISNDPAPTTPVVVGNVIKDTKGNDTLKGNSQDNTFVYTGGKDTIIDTGGKDTLVFGNGITFNQVGSGLMLSGNDLVLRVNGSTANQITLKDFFGNANNIIETIKFETGGEIDYKQIYGLFGRTVPADSPAPTPITDDTAPSPTTPSISPQNNFVGTNKVDKLTGTDGNDQLQGLAGADTLNGKVGNDILIGGSGNDTLIGGVGNDLYYFTKGFGKDTIVNTGGGYDNIYFENISFSQVGSGLVKSGNNLILKVKGTTDELTLKDFFLGGENADFNISFKEGGSITNTQLLNAFKSTKTAKHTDTSSFDNALEMSLSLLEQFKTLNIENNTTVI